MNTRAATTCLLSLTALLYGFTATAQEYRKIFTPQQIYAMNVRGFRLGMTQADATRELKASHWEGQWHAYVSPNITFPFTKGNSRLYLLLYPDKDKVLRLWSIVDKQEMRRPVYGDIPMDRAISDIWIERVVAHFGEPTIEFTNPNGVNAYVYYLSDITHPDTPKLETYLSAHESSYELSDRSALKGFR